MPTIAEIVDGGARPLDATIMQALTSVQGLRADPGETLYALDSGVSALSGIDRDRAALWAIDVTASTVARRCTFPTDVALPTTYLNDLALDHVRGVAYRPRSGQLNNSPATIEHSSPTERFASNSRPVPSSPLAAVTTGRNRVSDTTSPAKSLAEGGPAMTKKIESMLAPDRALSARATSRSSCNRVANLRAGADDAGQAGRD
jgi:hypothetical protein